MTLLYETSGSRTFPTQLGNPGTHFCNWRSEPLVATAGYPARGVRRSREDLPQVHHGAAHGPGRPACANPRRGRQIRAPRLDFSRPKGGPQDLAKNSKIHYRKLRFCVWITVRLVLSPATRGDGPLAAGCPRSYVNLQALRDPAPRILDRVGISRKWRIKSYVILQAWRGPAPSLL